VLDSAIVPHQQVANVPFVPVHVLRLRHLRKQEVQQFLVAACTSWSDGFSPLSTVDIRRRARPSRGQVQTSDHDEWIRVSKFPVGRTCILQKLNKQLGHLFRLLLLQPVTGSVYKVGAAHLGAGGILHGFERARALENAPIAFAADE
jgi:hypothetical protein